MLFVGFGLMVKHIRDLGFGILRGEIGLRNNSDFMGNILPRF